MDFSREVNSLNRVPVTEYISWAELHREWHTREDKVWGNILLHSYSPDTKLFKKLQDEDVNISSSFPLVSNRIIFI